MQSGQFTRIGNWWDRTGENEIDMVALNEFNKTCVIAEIKRNAAKQNPNVLRRKAQVLPADFARYNMEFRFLSLSDM